MGNQIRTFLESDWNEVKKICRQGINTNMATFQTTYPSFQEWDASYLKICRYVYEQDGKVVGWAALSPVSSKCIYSGVAEVNIYIANKAKHQGIGTLLLQKAIEMSEKNDIWTLQSSIIQNNHACILLYKKCGFRMIGYRKRIARDRLGIWKNTILMELRSSLNHFDCKGDCE